MTNVLPLKRFGQHYLKDPNIIRKIIDEFNPLSTENIVEVGSGAGALSEKLYERINSFSIVEIDRRVINLLTSKFQGVNIINADFLKVDLNRFLKQTSDKLRILGNIPYNLTSPIIFKLIKERKIVKDALLMVQHEVALRMTAKKGTKDYGILSVLLHLYTDTKICFKVSQNVFYPKPKVASAVVHLKFRSGKIDNYSDNLLIETVKASFGKRRKTLKNSLANSIFKEINFSNCGINLGLRAEQLDAEQFLDLAEFIKLSKTPYKQ